MSGKTLLNYKKALDGFEIYYKDWLFFKHSESMPLISMGKGTDKIRMFYGEYRIKDKVKERISLKNYDLINASEDEIIINFSQNKYSLQLIFRVVNNSLQIIPSVKELRINRFWIKIHAIPKETVYGCGAQYSKINLRGHIIKAWIQEEMLGEKSYFLQPTFI